ncbi:hypothetical protein BCR35DRAFT_334785 [Leucosporidium creatinivorum]|uniref:GDP-fucose protein O-fucosyltransferase-domain-containing protein n=1 Tax=Leucosporidium creatinivorum TaxID=106004 RepID=A0A1Y2DWM0_9BASI|nr:hypothetical protein BCR35DRAFT_334785 [Leucosporidium creatinivorum]
MASTTYTGCRYFCRKIREGALRFPGEELLLPTAPALSIYDSLDPQLRYLIADSWSGLSGQITSAFALLYLAQQTQRIAILPSWHDEGHYGDSIIPMSLLFDLEGLREATGLLFVELDDVKPQDPHHVNTTMDEIGCYRASPWFDIPLSLPDHNIHQTILTIPLPSETPWSYESFTLFDFSPSRLSLAATQASSNGWSLPRNMVEEDPSPQGGGLLCYTNLWDLGHVAGGVRRVEENGHFGNGGFESAKESRMVGLLKADLKGVHPEWWHVGRFVDFTPEIWDIALSSVYETLEVDVLPPLVTVHLRRGDFLSWCPQQQNCTPPASDYAAAVKPLLSLFNSSIIPFSSSPRPRVLVTTDETTDMDFLASIDQLGWDRINHTRLGTERKLREAYGEAWRWADSAVDQAILSLGQHFVGTRGSQVTQLSQLRVESWNGGQTAVVDRPAN